jgi:tyrosinase
MRPEPDNPPQLVGATEQPVQLTGQTVDVSFEITAGAGPLEARPPARVYLRLEDLTYEVRLGGSYAVYLNVPDDNDETPDDHYVGTASMFGVPRHGDSTTDHSGVRLVFDITDLYERLRDDGLWSDTARVRLVPVHPANAARRGPQAGDVPGSEREPGTVNVGQVSVFFQ